MRNPGHGLGQAHKCSGVKTVNVIPALPLCMFNDEYVGGL